jgi:alkylhydroperoxidase family enzyme
MSPHRPGTDRPDGVHDALPGSGFLAPPQPSPEVERLYDSDLSDVGYVMNLSRLWAHLPGAQDALFELAARAATTASLTLRQRGILVSACASTLGDAYCSLAWGTRLASAAGAAQAGRVLQGDDDGLDPAEQALARWARRVTAEPNGTGPSDVQALRDAGYDDTQIFAITLFVALRIAFSTVNDALGARPDQQLEAGAPDEVRAAVNFGRPVSS